MNPKEPFEIDPSQWKLCKVKPNSADCGFCLYLKECKKHKNESK